MENKRAWISEITCLWCNRGRPIGKDKYQTEHEEWCQAPKKSNDDYLVEFRLNNYQMTNLKWLLGLVGYPSDNGTMIEPFNFANTGDWVGEIYNMLAAGEKLLPKIGPNTTTEDIKQNIEWWISNKRKAKQIIINGETKETTLEYVSYDDLVILAFGSLRKELYSITYRSATADGILSPGKAVKLENKMVFNIYWTGNA